MLNKLAIALSAAAVLGVVSTASANFDQYDPWIGSGDLTTVMTNNGTDAFASTYAVVPAKRPAASRFDTYDPWIGDGSLPR
jgi:hypothetical protein